MSAQHEFYLARAAEARVAMDAATLENVRDRWRRSEERWSEMADRTARGEEHRAKLVAEKAGDQAELKVPSQS